MSREEVFRVKIVHLILAGKPKESLERLSHHYHVGVPKLMVGMPKGHVKGVGCYMSRKKTIYVSDRKKLCDPYVILHEFYHHLRTQNQKHRGTERYADGFAKKYLTSYKKTLTSCP